MTPRAQTDYRVVPVDVLGPRGGVTHEWAIHTGPYHKEVARFTSRREALDELARLVNEAGGSGEGNVNGREPKGGNDGRSDRGSKGDNI